jgi:hypothetical protein
MAYAFNIRVKRHDGQYVVECYDRQDHGPDLAYATTSATDLHTALSMMVPYMATAVEPMPFERLLR